MSKTTIRGIRTRTDQYGREYVKGMVPLRHGFAEVPVILYDGRYVRTNKGPWDDFGYPIQGEIMDKALQEAMKAPEEELLPGRLFESGHRAPSTVRVVVDNTACVVKLWVKEDGTRDPADHDRFTPKGEEKPIRFFSSAVTIVDGKAVDELLNVLHRATWEVKDREVYQDRAKDAPTATPKSGL